MTVSKGTSHQGIDPDANHQEDQLQDQDEQDAEVSQDDEDGIAIDPVADGTSIQLEKSTSELLPTNDVTIPMKR